MGGEKKVPENNIYSIEIVKKDRIPGKEKKTYNYIYDLMFFNPEAFLIVKNDENENMDDVQDGDFIRKINSQGILYHTKEIPGSILNDVGQILDN